MLSNTLVTNEVKDSAGTEVEFLSRSYGPASHEYAKSGETPNAPYRLSIKHQEIGSGVELRRRSRVGFSKVITGASLSPRTISAYVVVDSPIGDIAATTEVKNVLANLMSFCASLGASTTILYDCTGNGADALINGTI